jgi:hypothetical protein
MLIFPQAKVFTCRDLKGQDVSIPTLLYREKWCRMLKTKVKNKIGQ